MSGKITPVDQWSNLAVSFDFRLKFRMASVETITIPQNDEESSGVRTSVSGLHTPQKGHCPKTYRERKCQTENFKDAFHMMSRTNVKLHKCDIINTALHLAKFTAMNFEFEPHCCQEACSNANVISKNQGPERGPPGPHNQWIMKLWNPNSNIKPSSDSVVADTMIRSILWIFDDMVKIRARYW